MKKIIPFLLLLLGILVLVVVFFINRSKKTPEPFAVQEETALIEVPLDKRPIVSLTPTNDGHYLGLKIDKLNLFGATSMDYKLEYKVPGNPDQGVPGTVKLVGKDVFEAQLLLGSESSGKFRYDEGVESGRITLSYRNTEGKLLARFGSDFHLQNQVTEITSLDNQLKYSVDIINPSKYFFVTMDIIGIPKDTPSGIEKGPFGIFSSSKLPIPGNINLSSKDTYYWNGNDWEKLSDGKSSDLGIFYASSQ